MKPTDRLFQEYLPAVEQTLEQYLPELGGELPSKLYSAMRYGVLDGGKRIRPLLVLEFCRLCGGKVEEALPFACAVEMIHSYSLMHDDLPCMDNDELRRGKPSAHKAFGEDIALLAGDALLTKAFEVMLGSPTNYEKACKAAYVLAQAAGSDGMVGGQVIDLQSEGKQVPVEILKKMDEGKTVALIQAACVMGCVIAGANERQIMCARRYAYGVGLSFQIIDDILDTVGDTQTLGKQVGSDAQNKKSTYVSLLGLEEAEKTAKSLTAEACEALQMFGGEADTLIQLAEMLCSRKM